MYVFSLFFKKKNQDILHTVLQYSPKFSLFFQKNPRHTAYSSTIKSKIILAVVPCERRRSVISILFYKKTLLNKCRIYAFSPLCGQHRCDLEGFPRGGNLCYIYRTRTFFQFFHIFLEHVPLNLSHT